MSLIVLLSLQFFYLVMEIAFPRSQYFFFVFGCDKFKVLVIEPLPPLGHEY